MIERLELLAFRRGEHARGAEALVRRLGAVIDAVDPGALPGFRHELFDGLKEVHVQAGELVDASELGIGGLGGEAIIADEVPDDSAVLLLDMGAVVLLPGAAAREGDALPLAIGVQRAIDELEPLSVSRPQSGTGKRPRSSCSAAATR